MQPQWQSQNSTKFNWPLPLDRCVEQTAKTNHGPGMHLIELNLRHTGHGHWAWTAARRLAHAILWSSVTTVEHGPRDDGARYHCAVAQRKENRWKVARSQLHVT